MFRDDWQGWLGIVLMASGVVLWLRGLAACYQYFALRATLPRCAGCHRRVERPEAAYAMMEPDSVGGPVLRKVLCRECADMDPRVRQLKTMFQKVVLGEAPDPSPPQGIIRPPGVRLIGPEDLRPR